jgi:hypothetical protein
MKNSIPWVGLLAVLPLLPFSAAAKPEVVNCVVAEFRTLALTVHNPTERMTLAKQWLQTHGDGCSLRDIAILKSSSGAWLGTADSPLIQQMFDHYYESKAKLVKDVPAVAVAAPEAAAVAAPVAAVAAKPKVPEPVPAAKAAAAAAVPAAASAVDTAAAVNKGVEAAIAAAATAKMSSTLATTSTSQ